MKSENLQGLSKKNMIATDLPIELCTEMISIDVSERVLGKSSFNNFTVL